MMDYSIDWVVPMLRKPFNTKIWNIASSFTFVCVGLFSKLILEILNRPTIYNQDVIKRALTSRPKGVPLLTVSNHHSCFDDPGLWGSLDIKILASRQYMRWSMAAHDICFTNKYHSLFFMLGKCVPVIRGAGVYQAAVDFCIERLGMGDWVHIFPEGKVNMEKEFIRFKWGIGRLVYESPVPPIIVPMWHIGMDSVLPNTPPYVLRFGKRITMNYGTPIDLSDTVARLKRQKVSEQVARKILTDTIQEVMLELQKETERLHNLGGGSSKPCNGSEVLPTNGNSGAVKS